MTRALFVGVLLFLSTEICAAQSSPDSQPVAEAHGFASFGYSVNFAQPASGTNQLRVFDYDDRRLKLDVAELVVQHPAVSRGSFGFRADFVAGSSVPHISAANGLTRDIQQAFVSYVAPIGSGLHLDAGKFTTHIGAEVIEGFDGYNDDYSRGLVFGYAEPFTHTGVRAAYTFNPRVSALVSVVQGWDSVQDNNRSKSIGAQLALTPSPAFTVYANYIGGVEQAESRDLRQLFNVVTVIKPSDALTATVSFDHGRERHLGTWQGVTGIVAMRMTGRASVAWRAEAFADRDGVRTGTPQTIWSMTMSPALNVATHLILRGDLRLDRSTAASFESHDRFVHTQSTLAINAIVVF